MAGLVRHRAYEIMTNITKLFRILHHRFIDPVAVLKQVQDDKTYLNTRKIVMAGTGPRKMRKHFLGGFGPP